MQILVAVAVVLALVLLLLLTLAITVHFFWLSHQGRWPPNLLSEPPTSVRP